MPVMVAVRPKDDEPVAVSPELVTVSVSTIADAAPTMSLVRMGPPPFEIRCQRRHRGRIGAPGRPKTRPKTRPDTLRLSREECNKGGGRGTGESARAVLCLMGRVHEPGVVGKAPVWRTRLSLSEVVEDAHKLIERVR